MKLTPFQELILKLLYLDGGRQYEKVFDSRLFCDYGKRLNSVTLKILEDKELIDLTKTGLRGKNNSYRLTVIHLTRNGVDYLEEMFPEKRGEGKEDDN